MKYRINAVITVPVEIEVEVEDEVIEAEGTHFALVDAVTTFADAHLVTDEWVNSHRVRPVENVEVEDWTSI